MPEPDDRPIPEAAFSSPELADTGPVRSHHPAPERQGEAGAERGRAQSAGQTVIAHPVGGRGFGRSVDHAVLGQGGSGADAGAADTGSCVEDPAPRATLTPALPAHPLTPARWASAADPALVHRIRQAIDGKTKPLGALGRIEDLAAQIAALQGTLRPTMAGCTLVIFAADHGIAAEGVSAFPQEVTRQMVGNFLAGGAAASVFARTLGVQLQVVDAGVAGAALDHPALIRRALGAGTANAAQGPAMTAAQVVQALAWGAEVAAQAPGEALALGEMGIANTSAASLLAHKLTDVPLEALVGRGTGLDDAGLAHKRAVLARAAARTPAHLGPLRAAAEYGGFEIVMMAGAVAQAAQDRKVVLVDGFIATAAAALALAIDPGVRPALVFCHASAEAGHRALLTHLGARPLLDLGMRLGEGTGAILAWPLLQAAARMLTDMASFADAGVSTRD